MCQCYVPNDLIGSNLEGFQQLYVHVLGQCGILLDINLYEEKKKAKLRGKDTSCAPHCLMKAK